jgi:D-3-phosphoglycerate dehydrogenase
MGVSLGVKNCRTEKDLIAYVKGSDGVICTSAPFSKKVIEQLKTCRVIVRCGVGVDNIDLQAATKHRIYITNTPGHYVEEVSDHVIALLLALSRKIALCDRLVRAGEYDFETIRPAINLHEKVLGVIGFGRIGRAVAKKMSGFDLRCLIYDPYLKGKLPDRRLRVVPLEVLLSESDFITIQCPLTEETRGMIGERQLDIMKNGAYLINTARGGILNENALRKALSQGRIGGAALDALVEEPPKRTNPLLGFPNVILTPHIGWYSEESIKLMSKEATNEIINVFRGRTPANLVNKELENLPPK